MVAGIKKQKSPIKWGLGLSNQLIWCWKYGTANYLNHTIGSQQIAGGINNVVSAGVGG